MSSVILPIILRQQQYLLRYSRSLLNYYFYNCTPFIMKCPSTQCFFTHLSKFCYMWYLYSIRLQMLNLLIFIQIPNSPINPFHYIFSGFLIFSTAKVSFFTGTYICRTTDILMKNRTHTVHGPYLLLSVIFNLIEHLKYCSLR